MVAGDHGIVNRDLIGRPGDRQHQVRTVAGLGDGYIGRRNAGRKHNRVATLLAAIEIYIFPDDVLTIASRKDVGVVATPTAECVIAGTADEDVVAILAINGIVALAANQRIVTIPTIKRVIAVPAIERIVTIEA